MTRRMLHLVESWAGTIYIVGMAKSRRRALSGSAKIISSKTVFEGPIFRVVSQEVREPDGVRVHRDIVQHHGSIVIIPVDETTNPPRVLLERQYRHAAGQRLWELPAGTLEPGENKLAAAKRELLEETGYTARTWERALFFYVSPGFLNESMAVFLARDLKKGQAQPEEDERIAIRLFTLPQAIKLAMTGKIHDAKTLSSLFWLEKRLGRR